MSFNTLVSHFLIAVVTSPSILIFHSLKNFFPVSSSLVSSSLIDVNSGAASCCTTSSFISCFTSLFFIVSIGVSIFAIFC
jgi:hypothetical protein